jgi:Holliday junction resolvasome RuvABC endonuclease subunit
MARKKFCKLLSIDSSTTNTGYAVFENGSLMDFGTIDKRKMKDKEERFEQMMLDIWHLLEREQPHIVVIELTVVCRNADTQRKLTEILGNVRLWCKLNGKEYNELRPTNWRKLICGEDEKIPKAREDCKNWSMEKINYLYGVEVTNDDISDAILIGRAYINKFDNAKKIENAS